MSISHTTRAKRKGEQDGIDYHFVDRDTFTRMRDQGAFLEWAVVFDNYYGTTRKPVEEALSQGRDVLFDVDWQGAASLREEAEDDVVTVFILPPTAKDLEQRLNVRAQDPPETVRRRMLGASNEIQHWKDYDYVVVNYDVLQSFVGPAFDPRRGTPAADASDGPRRFRPELAVGALALARRCGRERVGEAAEGLDRKLLGARLGIDAEHSRSVSLSGTSWRSAARSILRLWPKAAAVTRSSALDIA